MRRHIYINKKISPYKRTIQVSSDKSLSIRTVLLASQAVGVSKISNLLESEDVLNTLKTIKKLGINYKKKKNYYEIYGFGLNSFNPRNNTVIDAGNSGTLGRLILSLLIKTEKKIKLIGDKSLSKRDFSRVIKPLRLFGAKIKSKNNVLPVKIHGTEFIRPINYLENIGSAQIKTACCFGALNSPGTTFIRAKKSRNHTELLFKYLKIPIKVKSNKEFDLIEIKGLQQYNSFNYRIPGDISSSAFFIVLTLLSKNSSITIQNVNINETRTGLIKILKKMNGKITFKNKRFYKGERTADIFVKSSKILTAINCPSNLNSSAIDELILCFLVAAKAKGISTFKDLGELNKKESPRLNISIKILRMMGIKVLRKNNNIKIYGKPKLDLKGNYHIKNFSKDHRIFMFSCIAALTLNGRWIIEDKDSVNTSFPKFIGILKILGAKIN